MSMIRAPTRQRAVVATLLVRMEPSRSPTTPSPGWSIQLKSGVLAAATVAKAIAAAKHAKAIGSRKRCTPALPAGLPLTVASRQRAGIIALVWPCGRSLDPHVVADRGDTADALRDGNRAVDVGARADEATQLD